MPILIMKPDKSIKPHISETRYLWLTEFYRQWNKARGKKIGTLSRPFRRHWSELLNDANLHSAEDRKNAQREAEELALTQNIKLHRKYARHYIILQIELSLDQECWLRDLYQPTKPFSAQSETKASNESIQ